MVPTGNTNEVAAAVQILDRWIQVIIKPLHTGPVNQRLDTCSKALKGTEKEIERMGKDRTLKRHIAENDWTRITGTQVTYVRNSSLMQRFNH